MTDQVNNEFLETPSLIPLTDPGRLGVGPPLAALAEWYFNCYDLRFCNYQ